MTVWKYRLYVTDEQFVEMSPCAELLTVSEQDGMLTLWARVDPVGASTQRRILIRGTGHVVGSEPYVGSIQAEDGLVWHVFDGGEGIRS